MNKRNFRSGLRTWLEIDEKALEHNFRVFRSVLPADCRLMSVVKSNAYGHGLIDFSKSISRLGVDWLGVDSAVEGLALRKAGLKKPILILGFTLPEMLKPAIENGISLTISSFESLKALSRTANRKPAKVHIKVDSGMGRQGFLISDQKTLISKIKNQKSKLIIEGLYTHLAAAKDPADSALVWKQLEQFREWVGAFKRGGFQPIVHAAASGGALLFPESRFDLVRAGIGLYGLWPSPATAAFCRKKLSLQPILTWKTVIGEIKTLKKGSGVGYDLTEILAKDVRAAVCPVGYWHGFPRALSGVGRVLVGGKKCRVLGRVSMDMIVVDITDANKNQKVKTGDEVVIIGRQGRAEINVEELARLSGTSNYEAVTRINPLIKRIYV